MKHDYTADMKGKTCVVTGATSGHGKAVAEALAQQGAGIIIHGRNPEKLEKAARDIYMKTGRMPEQLVIDFSSMADIRQKASGFNASHSKIDLLVNNAGVVNQEPRLSKDGYEEVFAVNYLAMYLFTLLILDRIISASSAETPARIVNISSDAHYIGRIDPDDPDRKSRFSMIGAYCRSKLAVVYFTRELALRLGGSGVTVNAVNPGAIASGIAKKQSAVARFADIIIQATFPRPEKAAETCLYVCMSPDVKGITGGYFSSMKQKKPKINPDPEFSRKLWEKTAAITGADFRKQITMCYAL